MSKISLLHKPAPAKPYAPVRIEDLPKIKMLKNRVAFTEVTEEITGTLEIPSVYRHGTFQLGQVWNIGPEVDTCKVGDVVLFQLPESMQKSNMFRMTTDAPRFQIMHADDILATIENRTLSIDNFHIAGRWLLFELIVNKPNAGLELPDNYAPPLEDIRAKLLQIGTTVEKALRKEHVKLYGSEEGFEMPYEIGDEIFPEKMRCNPVKLSKTDYATGNTVQEELVFCEFGYAYGVKSSD